MMAASAGLPEGSRTKHGFPRGYRFVPTPLELLSLLADAVDGRALPPPLASIFHDVKILNYHPGQLYERFKDDAEHRFIYFFSEREFQRAGAGGAAAAIPEHRDQREPRPVRVARGGGWKPSGGGTVQRWPKKRGGFVAGRMVTMVFYDRVHGGDGDGAGAVKTNWGMHEFIVPVHRTMTATPSKYTRFHDLALYRLYILKSGDMESEDDAGQMMPNAAYDHHVQVPASTSTSVPPCQLIPQRGIFTGNHQPMSAGASTSQMPAPAPAPYSAADYAQYYYQQHAFGAPQAHDMPVLSAGLPAGAMCQFMIPPPPAMVPVSPAAANPAPPATVPVSPAAANLEAPATAADGAGYEAAGHFAATLSPSPPPAAATSSAAEQDATAATEPEHAEFADCVMPTMEEAAAAPAPPEDVAPAAEENDEECVAGAADDYQELHMWNFDFQSLNDDDCRFMFSMDELMGPPGDAPAMEGETNSLATSC